MATFEAMPHAIEQLQATVQSLYDEVKQIRKEQPINEPPIDSKELMKRLGISEPTLRLSVCVSKGKFRFWKLAAITAIYGMM